MGNRPRAGGRYVRPINSTGAEVLTEGGPGNYTLTAGTFHFILGGDAAPFGSVHISGDAAIAITSATILDCNHGEKEVSDFSVVVGEWVTEDPTTGFVAVDGANWVVLNCVVSCTAGAVGGAMWHVAETGAYRTRLTVVVGTGGKLRVSAHGKD